MSVADFHEYLNTMYKKVGIAVELGQGGAHTGKEGARTGMGGARTGMGGARTGSLFV